ncbi:MAG: pitrilysin family protein [Planctomycetota bacterium]|nr:pitrilysin family protein [Planctomycetota bacterium]MDA1212648.1 pitrilysin family protein [Planctomycetota bacterium]
MIFNKTQLDNGLEIIAEINPSVHSVAVGFFVKAGSRDESQDVSGVSHFLEHMMFKGTEDLTAEDVNRIFDEVGANYNAATGEESTFYYAAVLPEYWRRTAELLAAILYPSLRNDDFEMEKQVILEEIGMYEDQPSFVLYDRLMQSHFAGHPLGQSILGSSDSVRRLTADQMRQYHHDHYRAGNIVLAVAGNTTWNEVEDFARTCCQHWPAGGTSRSAELPRPPSTRELLVRESAFQEQLMLMTPAPAADSPLRFAAELLTVVVGDDSGSRFYWKLVDSGLAEVAELSFQDYEDCGGFMTYLTCDPEQVGANLEHIREIFDDVNRHGVSEEELSRAKNKTAARIVLRSERPMERLSSLGGNWIYRKEYRSVTDDLQAIEQVTRDQIREVIDRYPLTQWTTTAIGPRTAW